MNLFWRLHSGQQFSTRAYTNTIIKFKSVYCESQCRHWNKAHANRAFQTLLYLRAIRNGNDRWKTNTSNGFTFKAHTHASEKNGRSWRLIISIFSSNWTSSRPADIHPKIGRIKWILLHKLNWLNYFLIVPYANFTFNKFYSFIQNDLWTQEVRIDSLNYTHFEPHSVLKKQREARKKLNRIVWKAAEEVLRWSVDFSMGIHTIGWRIQNRKKIYDRNHEKAGNQNI